MAIRHSRDVSLLRFLGLASVPDRPGSSGETETATVRRIVEALERQEPDAARYVARFAYVLSRAAHADRETTPDETRVMERIVMERGGLPEAQAILVVQIAKSQTALFGATEDYLVTRELARTATREQKLALLDCCFAVSAADREISGRKRRPPGRSRANSASSMPTSSRRARRTVTISRS